jgi:hypothetical protein
MLTTTPVETPAPPHWALDAHHRAINAGVFGDQRIELIAGSLYEMPPMREPHIGAATYLESVFAPLLAHGRLRIDKPIILRPRGATRPAYPRPKLDGPPGANS